ncbi:LCP family protein [Pullulanibacillus sp. KACC 23026]|uniref:LCP family glycopolymer transferase n=1 Tax=Pullulanibacillus sp. KACC 23026 TaxID=3028315 RepID=UPI0023B1C034|nr:LCP family protein [Pullulanibacillus sp. KACC 23026]WEG13146.1 LCP family protein [Pullulanibacillus sp. KACC 23026]
MDTRTGRKNGDPKKRRRRILTWVSVIVLLLIIGIGGYLVHAYTAIKDTAKEMHIDVKTTKTNNTTTTKSTEPSPTITKKPINILLLGVDERPNDPGRSDTIIVATLNPQTKSMLLTSIPRDTRALIVGKGNGDYYDKINAAYAYGGVDMSVATVQNLLGINIDYVAKINFNGLKELVDAVGGITVNNPIDWYDEGYYKKGYHYKKGIITLHGGAALGFARMRHLDPQGDFGRNLRQRLVIEGILKKAAGPTILTNLDKILQAVGDNVKTNATFDEMKSMAVSYRQCRDTVYTHEVYATPERINNLDYVVVSDAEKQKVGQMIQDELDGTLDMSNYGGNSSDSSSSDSSNASDDSTSSASSASN